MSRISTYVAAAALGLLAQVSCGTREPAIQTQDTVKETVNKKTIEEVLAEHTSEWMAIPGVVGTGIGECDRKPCITVLVTKATDSLARRIPKEVEGYPVRLEESGEIRAH